MVRRVCILVLLPLALHAQQSRFGEWKINDVPALTPGAPSAWDDFAIGSTSIVRLPDKWMMLYEGVALSENARTSAFGIAESSDGLKWNKRPENPAFVPSAHEWEAVTAPCITKWRDDWVGIYVANRALTFEEASPEDFNLPQQWVRLAHSRDGVNWESLGEIKTLSFKRTRQAFPSPCIYADANALHIWWIGESEQGAALFHSTSRDTETWSKPNHQLTKEIDTRAITCARVQGSGDYYILTYVALDEKEGPRLVTKISQNVRTWSAQGPPEFALPGYFKWGSQSSQPAPSVVFAKEGARLFYIDMLFPKKIHDPHPQRDPVHGAVLRTAFSQKQNGKN